MFNLPKLYALYILGKFELSTHINKSSVILLFEFIYSIYKFLFYWKKKEDYYSLSTTKTHLIFIWETGLLRDFFSSIYDPQVPLIDEILHFYTYTTTFIHKNLFYTWLQEMTTAKEYIKQLLVRKKVKRGRIRSKQTEKCFCFRKCSHKIRLAKIGSINGSSPKWMYSCWLRNGIVVVVVIKCKVYDKKIEEHEMTLITLKYTIILHFFHNIKQKS